MKALGRWSVEHRVSVNLIMVFLIVAGLYTAMNMRREMFPQFQLDMISISVSYPGATPEEVEEGICIKIEEQLKSLEDIKSMHSTAIEGNGSVTLELAGGTDINEKLDEVKTEIDLIDSFPEEAEDPVTVEIKNNDPAIYVAVYGDVEERLLRDTAERIRDDLVDTPEISLASLSGVREFEISVEISEQSLRRFNLSFDDVAEVVKTGSLELPGGKIKTRGGEFLVRAKGKLYTGEEFERIPLVTREDGTLIRLGDVAKVRDGFEESDIEARFNGKPAAMVVIRRTDSQDTIAISDRAIQYIEEHRESMPKGISLGYWFNMADLVQDRIDLLLKNGIQGILLVFIVLALFLNLGLSFWVAVGIPVSFMGAFLVFEFFGASINMLSLFGFIMTLGILVDDAIILGENVYTHFSMGKSPRQAVIDSMDQIGAPVVMAVTTTIVAFVPLMHITGIMGKFLRIMPQAVVIILAVSLLEAFFILPAHLEHALTPPNPRKSRFQKIFFFWLEWLKTDILAAHTWIRERVERVLNRTIDSVYIPVLKYSVRNRYLTLALGAACLIVSMGLMAGGHVPFVFFPKTDSNWIISEVIYPLGTPFETTEKTIKQIEAGAVEINGFFRDRVRDGQDLVLNTYSQVGVIPRRDWKPPVYGGHCAEAWVEIQPASLRPGISASEVVAKWRELTGDVLGTEQLTFTTIGGGPGGNPIEIRLVGADFDQLEKAAQALKDEIATFPGTFDITDDFRPGKMEKQVHIREGAKSLGVTMADIATQIRQAYYGDEALKVQRGKNEVKVMVRYSKEERESEASLSELRIRTRDGREIPLNQVARIEEKQGYSAIQRVDRNRVITVISDIDENRANARNIVESLKAEFLPRLQTRFPGVTYDLEGQAKRTQESLDSLAKGFSIAAMVMFLLLASQFRSYVQPVIIMTAIPFGLVGAVAGHLVMGLDITMFSIFGIVALSGIVVNDSLILIDSVNTRVREGAELFRAVIDTGKSRFRPVLLTSVTTVAGLFPLLLETSFQAQFLIPMAVSISFGLIAATGLTLVFVPALYVVIQDIVELFIPGDRDPGGEGKTHSPAVENQTSRMIGS
ncbi:efflux RND transporter permease subunit [Desulfospira joergensenii]|uniref:efflux RND transporter permease subunit n=1 Tax=Desulfospira joergensenii TaxID=53329 RepID=UPI0003B51311|nr:efflux RND transporter permease subunit [Desulfospira joergensenii]